MDSEITSGFPLEDLNQRENFLSLLHYFGHFGLLSIRELREGTPRLGIPNQRAAAHVLTRVATDADVAIGSRYVAGGAVDETWGFRRRQLSPWGNRMARWIAGLKGVGDCTAGFKAIRTSALRDARVAEISVLGYAFQVALLHRLLHSGARVVEEPIYFRDRQRGVTIRMASSKNPLEAIPP